MQYKHYSCCAVSVKDAQVFAYLIIFPSSGKKKTQFGTEASRHK